VLEGPERQQVRHNLIGPYELVMTFMAIEPQGSDLFHQSCALPSNLIRLTLFRFHITPNAWGPHAEATELEEGHKIRARLQAAQGS
jgi:hypothetical protein